MASDTAVANKVTAVRFGGYGGQGIVLTGMLLGKAACLYDDKEAVFTQSYGPEARGGASNADVVVSARPVDYPLITEPDVLVLFFQEAYMRFRPTMKPGGILILESELVHPKEDDTDYFAVPATQIAEELGNRIVANVVMLGFVLGKVDIVDREAAEEAIRQTVKKKTIDLNLRAFEAGYERAQNGS